MLQLTGRPAAAVTVSPSKLFEPRVTCRVSSRGFVRCRRAPLHACKHWAILHQPWLCPPGQPGARVPEAYLALRGCIEILGPGLDPPTVRAAALQALNGVRCRADFRTRREATDALAALAASIQARARARFFC